MAVFTAMTGGDGARSHRHLQIFGLGSPHKSQRSACHFEKSATFVMATTVAIYVSLNRLDGNHIITIAHILVAALHIGPFNAFCRNQIRDSDTRFSSSATASLRSL